MFHEARLYVAMRQAMWGHSFSSGARVMLAHGSGRQTPSGDFIAGSGDIGCVVEEIVTQDYSCILTEDNATEKPSSS